LRQINLTQESDMPHCNTLNRIAANLMLLALLASGPLYAKSDNMGSGMAKPMMSGMDTANVPRLPPVAGYTEGERIFFVHTEVSDAGIAATLTNMMGSPVPVVPALAAAPDTMLANVYAFENGVQPDGARGPLDYQPDVFDSPAGSDTYTPLRRIMLVSWKDQVNARLLTSAAEVEAAQAGGEIEITNSGIVVNMPFLTWPGGQR
tara:strand:+ start:126 stop:740 length:615 start_codon:yes stop_codon:yes gene_type:complete